MTKQPEVDSTVIADVCAAKLCYGQTYHEPCGSLKSKAKKKWVLFFQFTCPELNENVHNDDFLSMYSSHSTDFFVSQEVRKFKADTDRVDRFQLDTRVQDMVREMNRAEGFRIIGWFKPAVDDEGTAMEHKNFHIARLEPEKEKN